MGNEISDLNLQDLLFEIKEEVGILTINRPNRLNAVSNNTKKEIKSFLEWANDRTDFRAIVLTGTGEKAFCAGTDLHELSDFDGAKKERMLHLGHSMHVAIRNCHKPIIAAINGYALGSGCLLSITCDYSVAAETAKFGFPEICNGSISGIDIALLPRVIGLARTREMVLFGEMMTAQKAYEIGLINRVVPQAEVLDTAIEAAKKFLGYTPLQVELQKKTINKWVETDYESAIEFSIYASSFLTSNEAPKKAIENNLRRPK